MRLVSKPILCNYYVTYRCNAKCGFCDIWEKPSPYITEEDLINNLNDLARLGVRVIDFTGGEPLLHQELPRFLKHAKDRGFITTVTSNALLYPKQAEKLAGLIDMLHFSLDSHDAETHNKMRGVACYDHVMESIKIAKQLGEKPDILFTVFDHNIDEIEKVYNTITQPNDLLLILNPVFSYNEIAEGQLSNEQLDTLLSWAKKKGVYLNEAFIELRKQGGNDISDPVCKAASSTLVISPENKLILPCYHLGISQFNIDNNLYNLYNSDKIKTLIKQEGILPECQGCTINCYMQPSFAVEINRYWWKALSSTIKYNRIKSTWKSYFES